MEQNNVDALPVLPINMLVIICEHFTKDNQLALQVVNKAFYHQVIPIAQNRQQKTTIFGPTGMLTTRVIALVKEPSNALALDLILHFNDLLKM